MSPLDLNRPPTPESPLTSSLYHATSTMDDITTALADFSRDPTPEPPSAITCCCAKESCENLKSWLALKSLLGSRLILSAEVGQALLQRHEAYVRQHERKWNNIKSSDYSQHQDNMAMDSQSINDDLNLELETLTKEKIKLEKLLNQALVNSEVTEVSNKAILQELQDARETITRLTAHHARSIGWDTRLSAALKERDDMQQERDAETHRARLAESKFAVLKDKTAKLQTEVRRLQESLEEKRLSRLESSESILQDARLRIQSLRDLQLNLTIKPEHDELTNVLESLVNDNEILRGDNAELQHLLAESREDLHGVQERLEEQRANIAFPSYLGTPHTPRSEHRRFPSKDYSESKPRRRVLSQQLDSRMMNFVTSEFSIPDISRSPRHSPTEPLTPSQSSHIAYEVDQYPESDPNASETERRKGHRPLLLLTRSRGTQTENWPGLLPTSPLPLPSQLSSMSPHDPLSESSSFSDSLTSNISTILERVLALLNRMSQADALTLTNRLKRQNLKGADIGHLSRNTVGHIISEATSLRAQFRSLLEDDKVVLACTRKDMRLLFKFVKEVFTEMGQMRVTLNDVILDPSIANRVRELSLNPGKADTEAKEREISAQAGVAGWMAPISKLFTPTMRTDTTPVDRQATLVPSTMNTRGVSHPPRSIPKLGPALAASATTVGVEFSGTGRSMTSTLSSQPLRQSDAYSDTASGVMNIFAGAPRSHAEFDPWIVVPPPPERGLRKVRSFRKIENRSEDISEESDIVPPLLGRTLRRRGLSDSSIHSTFSSQADAPLSPHAPPTTSDHLHQLHQHIPSSRLPAWPERSTVFQALSRTVQNIRATAAETMTPLLGAAEVVGGVIETTPIARQRGSAVAKTDHDGANPLPQPQPQTPTRTPTKKIAQPKPIRIASSKSGDSVSPGSDPFVVNSLRDETRMRVSRDRGGRDHFF